MHMLKNVFSIERQRKLLVILTSTCTVYQHVHEWAVLVQWTKMFTLNISDAKTSLYMTQCLDGKTSAVMLVKQLLLSSGHPSYIFFPRATSLISQA